MSTPGKGRLFLFSVSSGFVGLPFLAFIVVLGLGTLGGYALWQGWVPVSGETPSNTLSTRAEDEPQDSSDQEQSPGFSDTKLSPSDVQATNPGYVVSVDEDGEFILVPELQGVSNATDDSSSSETPTPTVSSVSSLPYFTLSDKKYGLHTSSPNAFLHITSNDTKTMGLIVRGAELQSSNLTEWQNGDGNAVAWITPDGGAQFNVQGKDTDFRVRSSESAQALFIEGSNSYVGLGTETPDSRLTVEGAGKFNGALVVTGTSTFGGASTINAALSVNGATTFTGNSAVNGVLTLRNTANNVHLIELYPTGDTGYLNSSGGAFYIDNTDNIGAGYLVYSNAGAEAQGNLLNVKVDNSNFAQAGFYISYDGSSNGVEIVSNSSDTSSNALSVTGNNTNDSTVGIIGYESGRGTVKISHFKPSSSDANASAISIDLKGDGTAAQGVYVDSTATTGTTGNLLRLRNQSIDRFVVSSLGTVTMGSTGTNTSFTKQGNNANDHFFIGTTGSFRVQRSANDSETFRVQISGDANGRWLGTSDGKLKWGDGTNTQDTTLRRLAANSLLFDNTRLYATSSAASTYVASFNNTGATANSYGLLVKGGANDGSGTTYYLTALDGAGNVVGYLQNSSGTFSVNDPSDIRTKTNIRDTELDGLNIVSSLRVVDFNRRTNPNGTLHHGFIAQEVQSVFPYMVSEDPNGILTISKESLIPVLVKAMQQQQIQIDSLGSLSSTNSVSEDLATLQEQMDQLQAASNDDVMLRSELSPLARWSVDRWEWIKDVVFSAPVRFADAVTFGTDVLVRGRIQIGDQDSAGFAVLSPGQQEVRVTFERPFAQKPVIQALGESYEGTVSVHDVSVNGFTLRVSSIAETDVTLHWTALAVENARTIHSHAEVAASPLPSPSPQSSPQSEETPDASQSAEL